MTDEDDAPAVAAVVKPAVPLLVTLGLSIALLGAWWCLWVL